LCQRKYILDLKDAGMMEGVPVITPMNNKFTVDISEVICDSSLYTRLIGRIIYLTNTHPDITHVCII